MIYSEQGSGTVEYEFNSYENGQYVTLRAYSTVSTFTWTPENPSQYTLIVYAREVGDNATYELASTVVTFRSTY